MSEPTGVAWMTREAGSLHKIFARAGGQKIAAKIASEIRAARRDMRKSCLKKRRRTSYGSSCTR
jgi:hypothetical protein